MEKLDMTITIEDYYLDRIQRAVTQPGTVIDDFDELTPDYDDEGNPVVLNLQDYPATPDLTDPVLALQASPEYQYLIHKPTPQRGNNSRNKSGQPPRETRPFGFKKYGLTIKGNPHTMDWPFTLEDALTLQGLQGGNKRMALLHNSYRQIIRPGIPYSLIIPMRDEQQARLRRNAMGSPEGDRCPVLPGDDMGFIYSTRLARPKAHPDGLDMILPADKARFTVLDAVHGKHDPVRRGLPMDEVLSCSHINMGTSVWTTPFIMVDVDAPDALDAYLRTRDEGLVPPCTKAIVNPSNGHTQFYWHIYPVRRDDKSLMAVFKKVKNVLVYALNGDQAEHDGRHRNPYTFKNNNYRHPKGMTVLYDLEDGVDGVRYWDVVALLDVLQESGYEAAYDASRKRARSCKGKGSIDDGSLTALDPECIKGEVIPEGLRNATVLRVANYLAWNSGMDGDEILEYVHANLSFEQGERPYTVSEMERTVRGAVKYHDSHYRRELDPTSPYYGRTSIGDDGRIYSALTGECLDGMIPDRGPQDRNWLQVERGRRGGKANTVLQQRQRRRALKRGCSSCRKAGNKNRRIVMKVLDSLTEGDLTAITRDGKKIRLSKGAAVFRKLKARGVVLSRSTVTRHVESILKERAQAMEERATALEDRVGIADLLHSDDARDCMTSASNFKKMSVGVNRVLVPRLMSEDEMEAALMAVRVMEGCLDLFEARNSWNLERLRQSYEDSPLYWLDRAVRSVIFDEGLAFLKKECRDAGIMDLFRTRSAPNSFDLKAKVASWWVSWEWSKHPSWDEASGLLAEHCAGILKIIDQIKRDDAESEARAKALADEGQGSGWMSLYNQEARAWDIRPELKAELKSIALRNGKGLFAF